MRARGRPHRSHRRASPHRRDGETCARTSHAARSQTGVGRDGQGAARPVPILPELRRCATCAEASILPEWRMSRVVAWFRPREGDGVRRKRPGAQAKSEARLRGARPRMGERGEMGGESKAPSTDLLAHQLALSVRLSVVTFRQSQTTRPQLTACFTSAPILASSATVNSFSAKATGHMEPSSRVALSLKPSVAYRVLNFCAGWKKQTTLPSLA
jgi:hypothetical protein